MATKKPTILRFYITPWFYLFTVVPVFLAVFLNNAIPSTIPSWRELLGLVIWIGFSFLFFRLFRVEISPTTVSYRSLVRGIQIIPRCEIRDVRYQWISDFTDPLAPEKEFFVLVIKGQNSNMIRIFPSLFCKSDIEIIITTLKRNENSAKAKRKTGHI